MQSFSNIFKKKIFKASLLFLLITFSLQATENNESSSPPNSSSEGITLHSVAKNSTSQHLGTISLQTPFPDNTKLRVTIKQGNVLIISTVLNSQNGQIEWTSPRLPAGVYEVFYELPANYPAVDPSLIFLQEENNFQLSPLLVNGGSVHVSTNIPEAIFTLESIKNSQKWKGKGTDFIFHGLSKGMYRISFTTDKSDYHVPPKEINVYVKGTETIGVQGEFKIAGKLDVYVNLPDTQIIIKEIGPQRRDYQDKIVKNNKTFNLPEGQYRISLESSFAKAHGLTPPKPIDVKITPLRTQHIDLLFETKKEKSYLSDLSKKQENSSLSKIETVNVPAGRAIIGSAFSDQEINESPAKIVTISAFSIGMYEVTNEQFAIWLNHAIAAGTVDYIAESNRRGIVVDKEKKLVFKTFNYDKQSQITVRHDNVSGTSFVSVPGKKSHPVIYVSWNGAVLFCKDHSCRLPTEAEWEKAASMAITPPDEPLKKYRYGCSRDEIDNSWVNYKINDRPIDHFQVLTTPVGFYNGTNRLPLSADVLKPKHTNLSVSPCGAFDMSGNVWEWVSDRYDNGYYLNMTDNDPSGPLFGDYRVVKGGCYDSLVDGVRTTERMGLPIDYSDAYTGFRVVFDELE